MDDKKIKELLGKIKVPEADEDIKNTSISNALQKFEENLKNTQGVHKQTRLTDKSSIIEQFINLIKGNFMNTQLMKGLTFASILAVTVFSAVQVYEMKQQDLVSPKPMEKFVASTLVKTESTDKSLGKKEILARYELKQKAEEQEIATSDDVVPANAPAALAGSSQMQLAKAPAFRAREKDTSFASQQPVLDGGSVTTNIPVGYAGDSLKNAFANKRGDLQAIEGKAKSDMVMSAEVNRIAAPGTPQQAYYIPPQPEVSGDKFKHFESNQFVKASDNSVSTFSIDVDKTSYSYVRKSLNQGVIPQRDSIRLEEMVNYFDYDYPLPESKETPFKPSIAIYPTPWNKNTKLMHIGIKGYDIAKNTKPKSNLVFLIDTSGSMNEPDKLPLVKQSLAMLVNNLNADDTVGIVTYAGWAGVALEPTKISDKTKILSVLESLSPGGSTAGQAGITGAYDLAQRNFNSESVNRVILLTDGDFNVGISDPEALKKLIEQKRDAGIYLSVLGFGQGNYNDDIMQSLAQNGNGNAAYIDNLNEARKVLVDEASSTLFPIAKDVKIQVEFNSAKVKEYKLLGYETRALNREDFNNDKVDAGDVGAGASVTAIYEIVTTDSNYNSVDPLRYSSTNVKEEKTIKSSSNFGDEYAFLKIRYKLPSDSVSKLIEQPINKEFELSNTESLNPELKFASSVAAFSLILRNDISTSDINYSDIAKLAEEGKGEDEFGNRQEFINMVKNAEYLTPNYQQPVQPQSYIERYSK